MSIWPRVVLFGTALLVCGASNAQPIQVAFVSANFLASGPARLGWIDEDTVIFSVGSGSIELGTECWPNPTDRCNVKRSIQLWNTRENTVSPYVDDAILVCVSRGRVAYGKSDRLYTQVIGKTVEDTGLEASRTYSWDDCIASKPKTWVGENGINYQEVRDFKQYYDFKRARFEATRYGFPRTKITWRYLDGTEEHSFLIEGPWDKSDRLRESYYPTKVGVIVVDRPRNYLVDPKEFGPFFPGIISSQVGVSPSGCKASFFGTVVGSNDRKTEVRLYAVTLC
jgi:hypothetical protein